MKTCDYCMLPVGDDALEIDGQLYHPLCHKMMVEEACMFCEYYDEHGKCEPTCTLQAYVEKYLEEEAQDWGNETREVTHLMLINQEEEEND